MNLESLKRHLKKVPYSRYGGLYCIDCKEFHDFAPFWHKIVNVVWTPSGYVLKHLEDYEDFE